MATISKDVLARYVADAVREVEGVQGLVDGALHRQRGVRVLDEGERVRVELHLALEWGVSIPSVCRTVQECVSEYLVRMAGIEPAGVDVVVDEIQPP